MDENKFWSKTKKFLIESAGLIPGLLLVEHLQAERMSRRAKGEKLPKYIWWRDNTIAVVIGAVFLRLFEKLAQKVQEKDMQQFPSEKDEIEQETDKRIPSTKWQDKERSRQTQSETSTGLHQ